MTLIYVVCTFNELKKFLHGWLVCMDLKSSIRITEEREQKTQSVL